VSTPFSAFGVFDGHGGKSAATFASKELLPTVTRLLDCCMTAGPPAATPSRQHSSLLSPKASAPGAGLDAADAEDGDSWGVGVSEEDRAVWAAQEAMAERLPMVGVVPDERSRCCSNCHGYHMSVCEMIPARACFGCVHVRLGQGAAAGSVPPSSGVLNRIFSVNGITSTPMSSSGS